MPSTSQHRWECQAPCIGSSEQLHAARPASLWGSGLGGARPGIRGTLTLAASKVPGPYAAFSNGTLAGRLTRQPPGLHSAALGYPTSDTKCLPPLSLKQRARSSRPSTTPFGTGRVNFKNCVLQNQLSETLCAHVHAAHTGELEGEQSTPGR